MLLFLRDKKRKQTIISRSAMDFELVTLDATCMETEWIRNLLLDILLVSKFIPITHMPCDWKIVIHLVNQFYINKKTNRSIQVRYNL